MDFQGNRNTVKGGNFTQNVFAHLVNRVLLKKERESHFSKEASFIKRQTRNHKSGFPVEEWQKMCQVSIPLIRLLFLMRQGTPTSSCHSLSMETRTSFSGISVVNIKGKTSLLNLQREYIFSLQKIGTFTKSRNLLFIYFQGKSSSLGGVSIPQKTISYIQLEM